MKLQINKKLLFITLALLAVVVIGIRFLGKEKVDFNTEVKPLLNKKCISCHGGVKKEGGFSILFQNEALDTTDSGRPAIIPGDPDRSEMIRRLVSKDPEERMPYNHDPLPADEIALLKRWIKEGAQWGEHWAYRPLEPVEVPGKKRFSGKDKWVKNDIDHFILDKIKEEKLTPSPEADKATLLRRVSLDIIGIPAPEVIAQQYLADASPDAYEKLVDTLLALPQYGERWTAMWMDLARYADSRGYEKDSYRSIWRYRDWLISAFNNDKPYDVFLTEQLAGDLMPDADDELFLATAFNRNTMTNDEGGTDNEEFRTAAIMDRVNTTWETILGTTFACVQCHSHPYDPFKFEEYYKFMAFFNNTRDEDSPGDYPQLREFNDEDREKLKAMNAWLQQHAPDRIKDINTFVKTWQPSIYSLNCDGFINSELTNTYWLAFRNNAVARLKNVKLTGSTELTFRFYSNFDHGTWKIHVDSASGPVIATIPLNNTKGWTIHTRDVKPVDDGVHDLYFTYSNPSEDPNTLKNLAVIDWFYFSEPFPGKGRPGYDSAYAWYQHLVRTTPATETPVMMENPDHMFRPTHVFERGNWLAKTEQVQPDVPGSLNPMPEGAPRNRLGLAMWLTDKKNPLTSRTVVNRVWEQIMGQGIAETLEDLGTQGLPPTHKNLLDWLSWQFMNDYKWSLKTLIKEIVLSATYRQDSKVPEETLDKDPFNKYYARGARVRLSAEQVRDQALVISGLMSNKMFGKSVMPYQPDRIWLSPYDGAKWVKSEGGDQYRRAIYTYWKRTSPYPSMLSFDGVAREVCQARRIRTNTPLQALTTLNDEAFVEMAKNFALRMHASAGNHVRNQIAWGYQEALYHPIDPGKLDALENLYNKALAEYRQNPEEVSVLMGEENAAPDKAAMVLVANAMLNLDDLITKN